MHSSLNFLIFSINDNTLCSSVILLAVTKPRSGVVHLDLKRWHVSFNQSVVSSTNHNPAFRTRASLHGLSTPANRVDMSLGAFVPATLRQVHRRHDLYLFLGRYRREEAVGLPAKKNRNNFKRSALWHFASANIRETDILSDSA